MAFKIKRIYETAQSSDGIRVLVDRLWPRGVAKSRARLSEWMKDIAPSAKLRLWFDHKPERFAVFSQRYKAELRANPLLRELRKLGRGKEVTLLYGARDPEINHAIVLLSMLRRRAAAATSTDVAQADAD
jgi:uncharacterized protein YeaO (DUF488 family)